MSNAFVLGYELLYELLLDVLYKNWKFFFPVYYTLFFKNSRDKTLYKEIKTKYCSHYLTKKTYVSMKISK